MIALKYFYFTNEKKSPSLMQAPPGESGRHGIGQRLLTEVGSEIK